MPEQRISRMEDELGRSAALVGEIVDARKSGDFDTTHGNGDDDLLAAVEEFETAVKDWRKRAITR